MPLLSGPHRHREREIYAANHHSMHIAGGAAFEHLLVSSDDAFEVLAPSIVEMQHSRCSDWPNINHHRPRRLAAMKHIAICVHAIKSDSNNLSIAEFAALGIDLDLC